MDRRPPGTTQRPPEPDLINDCVHCGFCLPTCPSYAVFEEEMDSPRGRIVLMRVGHEEGARSRAEMVTHFDRCLGCMACVTACPSGVQYDKLIEQTRPQIERTRRALAGASARTGAAIFALFTHPGRLRALAPVLALQQQLGPQRSRSAGCRSPRLQSMLALAPPTCRARAASAQLPEVTPARGERAGRVALMQGCVQRVFFGDVNAATVRVLAAEGWEVHAPRSPRCCGALQMHAGVEDEALALARETIAAYEGFDAIVVNVAGCGSAMKDYGAPARRRPGVGRARRGVLAPRSRDVHELLADARAAAAAPPARAAGRLPRRLPPRPRPGRPRRSRASCCAAIPGLELLEPAEWELCCGSAGHLQPRAARGRRQARRAQGRQPRATGARGDRRRQPRLRAADRRAPRARAADLPPDDPARPLDPRSPPVSTAWTSPRTRDERARRDPLRRRARRSSASCTARFGAPPRRAARRQARARRARRGATLDFLTRRARSARATGRSRRRAPDYARPARRDHRPDRPQARHQRAQLGRARASWPTSRTRTRPTWAQPGRGPREPDRRDRGHDHLRRAPTASTTSSIDETATLLVRPRGWHLPEKHLHDRRRAGRRRAHGLRPVRLPLRASGCSSAAAALYLYLPKMEHHLEARLWNDVFTFTRGARSALAARHDPRDGADRDAARPRSRWTRSSTSCASTPTGSTPAAGTTSSR